MLKFKKQIFYFFILSFLTTHEAVAELKKISLAWSQEPKLEVWVNKLNAHEKQKIPILIMFGGFEAGAQVAEMVQVSKPLMVVSFQYPYKMKRDMNFLEKLKEASKMKKAILSMGDAIGALLEMLKKRQDVQLDKISIVGGSFGSPFAINAAVRFEAIKGLVLIHGFANISKTLEHQLYRHWKDSMPSFLSQPLAYLGSRAITWYLNYPNPEEQIVKLRSDQKSLMVVADRDQFIPPEVTETLWQNLQRSEAKVFFKEVAGEHILQVGSPQTRKVTEIIVKWMEDVHLL